MTPRIATLVAVLTGAVLAVAGCGAGDPVVL
jgi:hypothetical protein